MTIYVSGNNGQAPASALSELPGYNGDGTRHTAPHVTTASYARLRAAMQNAGMGDLTPTADGWSCYRDREAQQHMRDIGLTTIPVGQSIHGEWSIGSAVDFSGLGGFGAARHDWLRSNGGAYGWYQPGWAQANGSLPEPWHWEYDQRNDTHQNDEVDDMTPEESALLASASENAGEARRILTFMVTGTGAATDAEANFVHKEKQLGGDAAEARRMLGVELGWNPPAPNSPEVPALENLWGTSASSTSTSWTPRWFVALALAVILGIGFVIALVQGISGGNVDSPGGLLYVLGGGLVTWLGTLAAGGRKSD